MDVFPDEIPGLPPQRVVDFGIELHFGTSPISRTPHRMAPVELQELRVRAGNEPSYSGSARAQLEKSSARAQLVS